MRKLLSLACILCISSFSAFSQESATTSTNTTRPASIGFSFILNDFQTPQQIRSSSLSSVIANRKWQKLGSGGPGIAVFYSKGIRNQMDFTTTLAGSFVDMTTERKTIAGDKFLLEADASVQFKLFKEAVFNPYVSVGVGASLYDKDFGAIVPLGVGFKIRVLDAGHFLINSQYRIPATTETMQYHFMHSFGFAANL